MNKCISKFLNPNHGTFYTKNNVYEGAYKNSLTGTLENVSNYPENVLLAFLYADSKAV